MPALKGIHYAVESGRLAAEAAWRSLGGEADARRPYDDGRLRRSLRLARPARGAEHAAGVRPRLLARRRAGGRDDRHEAGGSRPATGRPSPTPSSRSRQPDRAPRYPAPDGKLTFDKLSSVFLSGNQTRDDQPNHIRVQTRVPRELAELWAHMCPAGVYEVGDGDDDGTVEVRLSPSNCVQCGAITAKGGRLTPPEGGSGPEYTLT